MLPFFRSRFLCAPEDTPAAPAAGAVETPATTPAATPEPPKKGKAEGVATKADLADLEASLRDDFGKVAARVDGRERRERVEAATAAPASSRSSWGVVAGGLVVVALIVVAGVVAFVKRRRAS